MGLQEAVRGLGPLDPARDQRVLHQYGQEFGCVGRMRLDHYSTINLLFFGIEIIEVSLEVSFAPAHNLLLSVAW